MLRNQQTNGVKAVTDSAKRERQPNADAVDDGTGKETHHGKGTVQGDVLTTVVSFCGEERGRGIEMRSHVTQDEKPYHFISQAGIGFSTTTQAAQGVEHAWTEETDKGHHAQLDAWGGIPARGELADRARFVHPPCGPNGLGGFSWRFAIHCHQE